MKKALSLVLAAAMTLSLACLLYTSQEDSAAYVSLINLLPSGVLEMERDDEGEAGEPSALRLTMNRLPETSCNIGMVYICLLYTSRCV